MASIRLALWGAQLLIAVATLAALVLASEPRADETADAAGASKRVCTLSERQTEAAIAAFAGLMPVFHHDRCANCHHAVDPFQPRGHVDIREEFARYRDRRLVTTVAPAGVAEIDRAHAAITRYLDGATLTPRERGEVMFSNACSACHDPPPATTSWRMPPPTDSFRDKDARKLCRHVHTNELTDTPAEFERHMGDDAFIKVGFQGTRGLNGLGESIASPYVRKPIVAPSHGTMMGHVRDWLDAQRNTFGPNPDCGCRPFRYALDWSADWGLAIVQSRGSATGGAAARTKIPLTFKDDGTITGEGSIDWNPLAQMYSAGHACTVRSESKMKFKIKGRVRDAERENDDTLKKAGTMEIEGVTELDARPTTVTCQTREGTRSFSAPMNVGARSLPIALTMKAEVGTHVRKSHAGGGSNVTIDVTLIEDR